MSGPLITASALSRAHSCPASVVMPREERPPGEAAEKGTALHEVVEGHLLGLTVDLPGFAPQWPIYGVMQAIYGLHGDAEIMPEVPYAFNGTARELENGGPREYIGATVEDICGTADQVSHSGDLLVVSDLKAGRWPVYAKDNRQLQALVAMAALPETTQAIAAIVQCPYDSTEASQVRVDQVEYDAIEIAGFRHDLRCLKRDIESQRENTTCGA